MRNPSEIDQAVSRTLRDSLEKLQRTAEELNQAVSDLVSACASSRPSNSLPPMLRAQTAASSLSGSLEVLSRFVIAALQPPPGMTADQQSIIAAAATAVVQGAAPETHGPALHEQEAHEPEVQEPDGQEQEVHEQEAYQPANQSWNAPAPAPVISEQFMASQPVETQQELRSSDMIEEGAPALPNFYDSEPVQPVSELNVDLPETEPAPQEPEIVLPETAASSYSSHQETFADLHASNPVEGAPSFDASALPPFSEAAPTSQHDSEHDSEGLSEHVHAAPAPAFDLAALRQEERDLHRRADRVAKVAMQDIKMLHPDEVKLGKENHDLCVRLRDDIERARREYDRRFHSILDHPVDYFYNRMVEILGDGKPEALGDYPYPTPVLRR